MNVKSEKQQRMFFERKIEQESDQNGRCKKETKNREWKKRSKEKGRNTIKNSDTHNFFKKWYIFQKSKDVKKKGNPGIEHNRDVKHNSNLKKKTCHKKTKFGERKSTKESEKNKETFQNEGFFGSRRLKKSTKLEMRKGQKSQEK